MMSGRLITFDVTNTLLKFRIPLGQQYAKVGLLYGAVADPDQLSDAFKRHWKEINAEQPNFGAQSGSVTASEWWTTLVELTFRSSGCTLDGKRLSNIASHLFESYSTSACWDVRPGARDVLAKLKQSHHYLGVISNFDHRLHNVLSDTGLLHFFDFVVASYNVNLYKPQVEIFNLALDKCNAYSSHKCQSAKALHVGDDLELDYLAAHRAGWNALLLQQNPVITNANNSSFASSPDIIQDIREVIVRVQDLDGGRNN